MVAAFAIDWGRQRDLPSAAATVYLRVRKHGQPVPVAGDMLSIGFRATVIDCPADLPVLLALVDRALTRARRHALILAGHDLAASLRHMMHLSPVALRGMAGVQSAWDTRKDRQRGMALVVDTAAEASDTARDLNLPTDPAAPAEDPTCADRARAVLAQCLAVGLTAAVYAGRYRLEGNAPIAEAIERAGWDLLTDQPDSPMLAPLVAHPEVAVASATTNHITGRELGG